MAEMHKSYLPTCDDWQLANCLVQSRARNKPRKESAELEGAAGEIAFARMFNLPLPVAESIHSDGGVDFRLANGSTVDVKAISGSERWRLGLLIPKRMRAGIYALIHIEFAPGQPWTMLGWQTGGFAAARGVDHGDHYRLNQRDLRPSSELEALL